MSWSVEAARKGSARATRPVTVVCQMCEAEFITTWNMRLRSPVCPACKPEWQRLRNSVRGPEGGRFVMPVKDQLPQFVGSTRPLPLARPDPVRPLGPGEIAFASPMPEHKPARTATHLVIRLLEDAIAIAGETSTVLPGWRDFQDAGFDWDSARWQQAVKPIAQAGGLIPRVSLGTAVAEDYQDLAGLLEAIELRKLRVPALAEEPVG